MKNYSFFISLLMVMLLSVGNVWADPAAVGTTLFSENFGDYSNTNVPSGSVSSSTGNRVVYGGGSVTYTCTDGTGSSAGTTKVTTDNSGNLAGGASPELMVGKKGSGTGAAGGSFSIAGIPSGGAQEITVSFKQNKQNLSVSVFGNGYVGSISGKPDAAGERNFDVTVADGAAATFTLTFQAAATSNVRVDDILVTVKTAGEGGAPVTPTCATPTFSPAAGSYEGTQNVTISSTAGATIYYTTDSSTPTASSSVYSSPIAVSADMTIKAYAVKAEYDDSEVAEAAYTITEGPDVTLDFTTNNSWELPTTNTLDEKSYTSGDYTISIAGAGSGNGFKFSTNYLILGKSGAYIILPQFSSPVEKIVVVGNSGGSKSVVFNIFDGNTPVSTAVTGCTTDKTFEIKDPAVNKQYTLMVTSKHNLQLKAIKFYFGEAPAIAKPTISGDENFVTSTTVTLACSTTGADVYYTIDGSDPKTSGTIGTSFSLTETATVRAIAKLGSDWSAEATPKTFTKVEALESLAALKAKNTGSSYLLNLTDAIVTLVDGNNAFIEDATAGALIYFSGHGYAAGDKLNGQYEVTTATYQGKFEITAMEAQAGATKEADAEIPVTTLTIAQLAANFAANESKRIKIVGVNVTDAIANNDRNGQISDGANTFAIYAGKNGIAAEENANIDIIGYPTFFNEAHQFNVWAQADITVNEKENPELAYSPATQTIEQGGAWSAPTLTNPHSVTIASYTSDNKSVATVTDAGVIALAGGLGTAVITAHFNGDATYNAGNATYTITVNAADPRNNAVSPAEFTTTSGNLNPADITYASYQGGASTAPAIYNDGIRLYQAPSADKIGGYITLKAKKGCTIDQVKITTTNSYATTVAYSVDGNENLLGSKSVAKSSDYSTPSGLNVESVNIVNKGTSSSGRLEIASIKVWYTGDPLDVDHYFLGGTYETTFEQNGTFDYTGLEVYASYDAGEMITEPVEGFTVDADLSTAGAKKAEVYLNEVKIAEYDITVTAGKENPALAYSPASATITAGDAWSAPTLSNTFHVSPITYSSDKESVATVDENGVITLAGGYGTAVITAHFDETAAYVESEATYTITVNKPAPTPTTTVYRKVTETEDITDGEYLIVYEGDAKHDAAVFDGSLDNVDQAMKVLAVEIENKEIAGNTDLDAATFTIDVTAGSLQSASGWYIGRTANSNGMDMSTTEAYVNTFAITGGAAVITGAGGCTLRYNYASDQLRFRYYKSGQQAIQLYKKESADPVVPEPDYTRSITAGQFGTICLPNSGRIEDATIFEIAHKKDGKIFFDEISEATMVAGRPYIFYPNNGARELKVYYTGSENAAAGSYNGLHGSYVQSQLAQNDGNYILYDNKYYLVDSEAYVGANRAYIKLGEVPTEEQAPAPGRRRVSMDVQGEQVATSIINTHYSNQPMKVMIDNQLYIIRAGQMFDMTGNKIK